MIDVKKARGLSYWAKILPPGRNGASVSVSTLVRWILEGRVGPDGNRVRLGALRLGTRWLTDEVAIQTFAERLTPDLNVPPDQRTQFVCRLGDERADRELTRRGL